MSILGEPFRFQLTPSPTTMVVTIDNMIVKLGFATFDWAEFDDVGYEGSIFAIPHGSKESPRTVFLGPAQEQTVPVDPRSHGHRVGAWMDRINSYQNSLEVL